MIEKHHFVKMYLSSLGDLSILVDFCRFLKIFQISVDIGYDVRQVLNDINVLTSTFFCSDGLAFKNFHGLTICRSILRDGRQNGYGGISHEKYG